MRQLGQLEAAIMERLWVWDRPVAVREVLEDLTRDRPLAYTTVLTVLDNLHSKGIVRREKSGRAFHYSPTLTREEHTAGLLEQVLADSTNRGATLLHFVGKMDATQIHELRSALDQLDDGDKP